MTHTERIRAVLNGDTPDRQPIAAWGHFMNLEDRNAVDFAKSLIDFQDAYQFDIVKIMSNSYYLTEDMGNVLRSSENGEDPAFLCATRLAVEKPEDWRKLKVPDISRGAMAREIEVAKRLVDYYHGTVPILPTIFSPLMWCVYLYMPMKEQFRYQFTGKGLVPHIEEYLLRHEKEITYGLEVVTETNSRLMEEFLRVGVDGFFYSQPYAHKTWSDPALFERFAKQYDLKNLNTVADNAWFTMLHVCGTNWVDLDLVVDYPVQALNWDDAFEGNPSLKEGRAKSDKVLMGGMDRRTDLLGSDREVIKRTIKMRAGQAKKDAGEKLILTGGCSWTGDSIHRFNLWQETMDELKTEVS